MQQNERKKSKKPKIEQELDQLSTIRIEPRAPGKVLIQPEEDSDLRELDEFIKTHPNSQRTSIG